MTRVFCFGTLLSPNVQRDLWSCNKTGPVAELPGVYIDHSGDFPKLRGWPGKNVAAVGRVLELDDVELHAASVYEGPDYVFSEVELVGGEKVWAFV